MQIMLNTGFETIYLIVRQSKTVRDDKEHTKRQKVSFAPSNRPVPKGKKIVLSTQP